MPPDGLVVAVTGPTGEIGVPFIRALEQADGVAEIRGMARSAFDPAVHGWTKTSYVQGDILDRSAVEDFVAGADVVVHLAFIIFGGNAGKTRRINLEGSRNVFEAAIAAGATRLVYTSSVAAYGFHDDNPQPLTEDVPAAGSDDFYYSAQKAELEAALHDALDGSGVDAYIFRPCIVGGPDSPALVTQIPYVGTPSSVPGPLRRLIDALPGSGPVVPNPGTPIQAIHADDVASALVAAVLGQGDPGTYNLAGDGDFTMKDLAAALGWRSVPVPGPAIDLTAMLARRVPLLPSQTEWIEAARVPVLMDTTRARRELGWAPRYDALTTLRLTVEGARARGLVDTVGRQAGR